MTAQLHCASVVGPTWTWQRPRASALAKRAKVPSNVRLHAYVPIALFCDACAYVYGLCLCLRLSLYLRGWPSVCLSLSVFVVVFCKPRNMSSGRYTIICVPSGTWLAQPMRSVLLAAFDIAFPVVPYILQLSAHGSSKMRRCSITLLFGFPFLDSFSSCALATLLEMPDDF